MATRSDRPVELRGRLCQPQHFVRQRRAVSVHEGDEIGVVVTECFHDDPALTEFRVLKLLDPYVLLRVRIYDLACCICAVVESHEEAAAGVDAPGPVCRERGADSMLFIVRGNDDI